MRWSMPLICCSITCTTVFSTVCAEAPGYVVEICTVGGAIGGTCSTGSVMIERPPANMMSRAITIAKIGRAMKNLAMSVRRPDRHAGLHLLRPGNDHALAFL